MLRSIANQRSQSRFRDNVGLRQVSGVASVLHRVACAVFFVQGRCRSDRVSSRTRAAMNVLLRTTSASPTHTPPTSTSEVYACQFYAALLKKICGPQKHQICGRYMRKYGTELLETNYPISFHRGPDTWMVHSAAVGNQMVEVTNSDRSR